MLMNTRSITTVILLVLLLAACGSEPTGPANTPAEALASADAAAGQKIYASTCAACHGPDAKGIPGLGKDLTTSQFVADQSDEQLFQFVVEGRPSSHPLNTTGVDMLPKGGNPALTVQDIANVVAYLRSIYE